MFASKQERRGKYIIWPFSSFSLSRFRLQIMNLKGYCCCFSSSANRLPFVLDANRLKPNESMNCVCVRLVVQKGVFIKGSLINFRTIKFHNLFKLLVY